MSRPEAPSGGRVPIGRTLRQWVGPITPRKSDCAKPHEGLSERATRERRFVGLDRGELKPGAHRRRILLPLKPCIRGGHFSDPTTLDRAG
jgi:hypothetical protein